MAQTVEEIAEILNEMKVKNDLSSESIEKALTEINLKLAVITDDESLDLIKFYVSELKNLIEEKFNSSSVKMDNIENLFRKINYSEDFGDIKTQLKQIAEELSFQINSIPLNVSFDEIEQKIDECKSLTDILRDEFHQNATISVENSKKLVECLVEVATKFDEAKNDLNKNSFRNYESLKSLIEKVLLKADGLSDTVSNIKNDGNIDELNIKFENIEHSLDEIKELASQISVNDEIKALNKSTDSKFEQIADCISDVKSSFENNSKTNYENLINEINNLKTEVFTSINNKNNFHGFDVITTSLDELSGNVEVLREISLKKYQEIIDNISNELRSIVKEADQNLVSNNDINFGEIKAILKNVVSEFDTIKSEFLKANDSVAYSISAGFNNVNTIFENIFAGVNSLGENFDNISKQNAQNILSKIGELNLSFEELKNELNQSVFLDKITSSINSLSAKIDEIIEKGDYKEDLDKIKDALAIIKTEADIAKEELARELKENTNIQSEQLRNVSENIVGLREYIDGVVTGLKNYIDEIETIRNEKFLNNEEITTQKLLDLGAELTQNSQEFDVQFKNLQSKLSEFVHIVEGSNSDTEGKILSSLEEVTGIKDELLSLHEVLDNLNTFQNEKFAETISLLDAGVENIVFSINNINDSLKDGVENSVKENIVSIEDKFVEISDVLGALKSEFSDSDEKFINEVADKIVSLKNEISLVNTDIKDIIKNKADEIVDNFVPLKASLDSFVNVDMDKIIQAFKSELELSFLDFTANFDKELESNAEIFSGIKETYKEILNKVSIVEEVINKTLQNNIELLGISFETAIRGLNSELDEKFDNQITELKAYFDIASNDTKIVDLLNEFKEQLTKTIENFKQQQENFALKTDEISANISILSDSLKSESKNIIQKCSTEDVKNWVQELKLDNTDIKEGLETVDKKIRSLSSTSELLSILNTKVDVLASDDLNENLLDEIDEIKNIIYEQHKIFKESSDERTSAIDKYLRDVLLKLENVDIEKSSEDIKDTVLNAVLSLSDQISFVEETEEIKDFVEEKTDTINQSIIEVHKQLKQLTSGDDDFQYTYTLQDVESDIAKLRLAMNNISTGKFEDISDEIKRIVMSVENLESTLTQDQIIDLKTDIERLNDDILSISSRTNKILLNSDESYRAVNDGLNNFSDLILRLEDRINYLDNTAITERLERKIDNIQSISASVSDSNKVINQAMMYMGEWVDSTTQDLSTIYDNVSMLPQIEQTVDEIKESLPDKDKIIYELQKKFERQEAIIDNLERKIDKILSILEEKDDMLLNRKVDKIEKMLSGLGANIEKLTSYVDEE